MYDNHVHIFNYQTMPDAFSFGQRFEISRAELVLLEATFRAAKAVARSEPIEAVLEAVDVVLDGVTHGSQRWTGLKRLIRWYWSPVSRLVADLERTLETNGVKGANILIPWSGSTTTTARSVDLLLEATEHRPRLRVFGPWEYADRPIHGIKVYPAMEGDGCHLLAAEASVRWCGKPIIAHCSPGGIRLGGMQERTAKILNVPGHWHDLIRQFPVRVCLAHAGGTRRFVDWHTRGQFEPGEIDTLDNLLRDSTPAFSETPGRIFWDCAFHDDMGSHAYRAAVSEMQGWWTASGLWGTDRPLQELGTAYSTLVDQGRTLYPDSDRVQAEFLGIAEEEL